MHHLSLSALVATGAIIPAIPYARVSSEKQLRGEGLRRQREGTYAWIVKHAEMNIRLDDEQTDAARSAWRGDHVNRDDGALGKLLKMVETGELRPPLMIIVEHLDRLSRQNPWKACHQLSGMVSKGIFVATTKDDKIYSLESGVGDLILSVVYMCAANDESEKRSERVSHTKRMRVLEAMTTKNVIHQNVPGWILVREAASSTNRATRKYELIPHHCDTVLAIYQKGLHSGAGYICSWLIADNVPAMGKTGEWNIRHVKRILRSRAVLGHLESRHGLMQDQYPAVPGLTEDLWLRVQAAQNERRDNLLGGYKLGSTNNLLAGIGVCAACGGKMRINTRNGRRYYECMKHVVLKTCSNRSRYRVDRVEDALFEFLDFLEISVEQRVAPEDVVKLTAEHAKQVARQKRLEAQLRELDDDEMGPMVIDQLRELRRTVKDAATALSAAKQQSAVASGAVTLCRDADRGEIATGLKVRLARVMFDADRGVTVLSRAGVALLVRPDKPAALLLKAPNGQMANVREGTVHIERPAVAGLLHQLPPLDTRTISEVQKRLRTVD